MPRIPAPPLPKALQPRPKRPGEENGNGAEHSLPIEAGITVVDWIDERMQMSPGLRWLLWRKVPRGVNWPYTLGSATLFAFLNQAVTGVFLAMYYRPDAAGGAYESIRNINDNVFLGQLVHAMHKWGASVMIILIFLHMGRVFFFGAYKYPRELTWVIGVVLLILTLAMGFTGYLLPFDQRSYWATIVGDQHQRRRTVHRALPVELPARRRGLRRHHAVAVLRDPHAADPWPDGRADRRPSVPGHQARHLGAAVDQASRRRRRRSRASRDGSMSALPACSRKARA